jgi:FkbM family methyltransferase
MLSFVMMLKSALRSTVANLAARLPHGVQVALMKRLADNGALEYDTFLAMAGRFHVTDLKVRGEYGTFQSTSGDSSVLGVYARSGTWAPIANGLLREFFALRGGGTYVDVGANIGLTSVPIAQNAAVRCIALEPEPTNFANLVKNVQENCSHGNVTALQVAAFSRKTVVQLELASGNLGDHRIRVEDDPRYLEEHARRTIEVVAAPLDDVVGPVDGTLAVKIDTQGAEPFVIEGGKETLGRAELVIIEFWPYAMQRMGANPEAVLRYFEDNFSTISLFHEDQPLGSEIPVERALSDLRHFVQTKSGEQDFYLDLVATRAGPAA